jgi:hypothetical protein
MMTDDVYQRKRRSTRCGDARHARTQSTRAAQHLARRGSGHQEHPWVLLVRADEVTIDRYEDENEILLWHETINENRPAPWRLD